MFYIQAHFMTRKLTFFLLLLHFAALGGELSIQDSLLRYHPAELKPELELALEHDPGIESFSLLLEAEINLGEYFYADSIYDLYFDALTVNQDIEKTVELLLLAAQLNKIQQRNNLALSQYQKCLDYYRSINDWEGEGNVITKLGEFYRSSTQYEDGMRILNSLIEDPRFEELSPRTKAAAFHRLAAIYNEGTQNFRASIDASRRALYYSEANNALDQMATSYLEIGYTYFNRGDSRCINYFRKAMSVWQQLGYGHYIANTHLNIASYFVDVKQIDSAEYHLGRAMEVATNHKLPGFFALLLSRLSQVLYEKGEYKRAFELRDSAAELRLQDVRIQFDMDLRESVKKYQYDLTLTKLKTAEKERQLIAEEARAEQQSNRYLMASLISMSIISLLLIYLYRQIRVGNKKLTRQSAIITKQNDDLSKALAQKDILLKEVHHRVKNNLQMIISLLEMQEMGLEDPIVSDALKDSVLRRISAMALVHEHLYSQSDLSYLQANEYLKQLVKQSRVLSNPRGLPVLYKLDLEPCSLSIGRSVALGMILSELLSNSHKYAFEPSQTNPTIRVELKQDPEDENLFSFFYSDNGKGLGEEIKEGLGTKLIEIFAKQLEADINIFGDNYGYRIHLKFYRNFEN